MYYIDFFFINKFFNIILFLICILIDFLKLFIKIIFNIKSFSNIFLILFFFIKIFFLFLKKKKNDIYKKYKLYKFLFLNIIFFIFLLYLLNIKDNFILLIKNIYINIGDNKKNIFSLIISILWIFFTIIVSIYNINLLEILLLDIEEIDLNYRILLYKIVFLFFFFFILILGTIFINFDRLILGIIGGAISLSVSLGLQKTFNNYLSGILILLDKSFKIGDAVNINNFQGVITQINNRYIMLRNLDCSEILIPNERFINEIVQNQSLFFSKGNLRISIQISYNNNINLVLSILIESTENIERVLDNPPPISYLTNFNINGVELELSFWISDAVRGAALVRSEVNIKLWNLIKLKNIELAYSKKILKLI